MEEPNCRIVVSSLENKVYTATLYVFGRAVISASLQASQDDEDPGGSAIALMWLRLAQRAGKNIHRVDPKSRARAEGALGDQPRVPSALLVSERGSR